MIFGSCESEVPFGRKRAVSPYGNTSSAFISILLNANSFFPKSLRDAPR